MDEIQVGGASQTLRRSIRSNDTWVVCKVEGIALNTSEINGLGRNFILAYIHIYFFDQLIYFKLTYILLDCSLGTNWFQSIAYVLSNSFFLLRERDSRNEHALISLVDADGQPLR